MKRISIFNITSCQSSSVLLHFLYTSKYITDIEELGDVLKNIPGCEQLTQGRKENPAVFHAKMYQIRDYFGVRLLQLCAYQGFVMTFFSHQNKILKTKSSNVSCGSISDTADDETSPDEDEEIHYNHSNDQQKMKDGDSDNSL